MKQKIIFIVDGNNTIGLGQVYRSLNLAKEIKKFNKNILFITNELITKELVKPLFHCKLFSEINLKTDMIISKNDLVIIDKHEETHKKLNYFKSNSNLTIGIDYIGKGKKLLSKGINILYPHSGITGKNSYSGFQYSILDPSFKKSGSIKIRKQVKSLVIMQGGTDSHCFIPNIIDSISQLNSQLKITIIIGPIGYNKKLQKSIDDSNLSIKVKRNIKFMHKELARHDIAITGGGMTLLELSKLGIPSIIICTEKFETETASLLSKSGFGINLGYYEKLSNQKIKNAISKLIQDHKLRTEMNSIGPKIIDGNGTKRVCKLIEEWN